MCAIENSLMSSKGIGLRSHMLLLKASVKPSLMSSSNVLTHFLSDSGRLRGLLARVVSITAALAALLSNSAWCEIIPPDRTAPWQGNVGVPGGIPARTRIHKNIVTDLGADPTGKVDAAPIIQRAILSCPVGQVVYMPAGTFKIATPIYPASKSNFTLRGAGQGQTILHVTTNNVPIYSSGVAPWPPPSDWIRITAGATKGSNTITLSKTSNFAVDMLFTIGPNRLPTWAHNLGGFPDRLRTMGGMFKVRSKTARTITFDPPLPFDFSGMNPMAIASRATTIQGVGYESFTVELRDSTAGWAIELGSAWGCWIYDVEVAHAYTRQTYSHQAVRCEYRHCYIHDAQAQGPNHEGLDFTHSSWNLVEDNIFNQGGSIAVIFGDGGGQCLGNVIAYNYCTGTAPGWWDISVNHGPHNMLNLIEGNVLQWYKDDGYFGSSSHNTLLRNSISGQVTLKHFSTYYNIVGNILGALKPPSLVRVYESNASDYWNQHLYPIFELGFPNIGNAHFHGTFGATTPPDYHTLPNTLEGCQQLDRNVKDTIIRHGNYDYVNNAVVWDPNILDHAIPNSLFYSSQPSWWTSGLPWPPIGPDLTPMTGRIPAQVRYEAMGTPTSASRPLTIIQPTGGEVWAAGSVQQIKWDSTNLKHSDHLIIQYSRDGGASWLRIAQDIPAFAFGYWWQVDNFPTTQGRVRILLLENHSITDRSDVNFTVQSGP